MAQEYDPYEDENDPLLGKPIQTAGMSPDALKAQAQALYGGKWDADAEGDFANRMRGGQSAEQLLANTADDYKRRFQAPSGSSQPQQTPQYQTPTQQWNSQPAQPQGGSNELYSLLMQRAQQGTAVDRNDPSVRQQVDPAAAQMERASRNSLDDIAEKAGPLANLTGERRLAAERSGQAAGQLESEVIGRLQAQKAQEIEQALLLWGNRLSDTERQALERELAQLSDARASAGQQLQRDSLGQNNDQFMRELALREADQNNTWDYRWATLGA